MKYRVLIEQDEDGAYVVECPPCLVVFLREGQEKKH